jgi:hypothetical protein
MTVLECLLPAGPCSIKDLWRAASLANWWAKRVNEPATRRILYKIKDECLARLLQQGGVRVLVRGDQDRHRGLLSISLAEQPRERLHSHENWLPAA